MPDDLFSVLKVLFGKLGGPGVENPPDLFMIVRYLSLCQDSFIVAKTANMLAAGIPAWAVMNYLYYTVKKTRPAPFISYPKSAKKVKEDPKAVALRKAVAGAFCCSLFHADQIVEIYRRSGKDIAGMMGLK